MRIGQKLIVGFVGIALLVGVVGYVAINSGQKVRESYHKVIDDTVPEIMVLENIKIASLRMMMEAISFVAIESERKFAAAPVAAAAAAEEEEEFLEAKEEIEKWEAEYAKGIAPDDVIELQFVKDIDTAEERIEDLGVEIMTLKKKGISGEEILEKTEELEEAEESFLGLIGRVIAHEKGELAEDQKIVNQDFANSRNAVFIVTGLALLLAVGLGLLIARSISGPVTKLRDVAIEIGKGDLSKRAEVKSKDEIGQLATSFNQMTDEIQKRNEELQTMNEELRSTNEELETSNEELQSTTEELEASNEELRTTQEELIQKEKLAAVGQLASGVGHELRNPLGVIKNAVYYIKTKVGAEDPKLAKHLNIMEKEIANSNKIIGDLLGFSRTRLPAIVPSDMNKVVEDTLEVVEIPENIKLVKELGADLPHAMADPDQIQQVFVNLSLNAIQAMPKGGSLTIATRVKGKGLRIKEEAVDCIEIEFSDTGCGIPEENIEKLYDPFFTTKARGIGLGLAVTQGIIERHNGSIEVKSEVGKGTTFTVTLPVAK